MVRKQDGSPQKVNPRGAQKVRRSGTGKREVGTFQAQVQIHDWKTKAYA